MDFAYVLPNHPGQPAKIVVPSALQMGWVISHPFFCASSETARDVASSYVRKMQAALPEYPLEDLTMPEEEVILLDMSNVLEKAGATLTHILEVYVDNFIQLAQTSDPEKNRHLSRALMHGIHNVFPP